MVWILTRQPGGGINFQRTPLRIGDGASQTNRRAVRSSLLRGVTLGNADMDQVNLQGAVFAGANLSGAHLNGARFDVANLQTVYPIHPFTFPQSWMGRI